MKDLVKSVLKVFDGKQKRKLVGMMFLILINSGVSLLGVSVLSPFITAVMNPEELLKNDIIRSVYDGFHMQNTNQLITLLSVLIIIVYIAKNAFIIFINNMLYCFSYYGKREMQDRMMKYYISRDYTFFLNHNSAELMRDINTDPEMFYAAVKYAPACIRTLRQPDLSRISFSKRCAAHLRRCVCDGRYGIYLYEKTAPNLSAFR